MNQSVQFKLDTGAKCNVMSKQQLKKLAFTRKLTKTNIRLVSYSRNIIEVEGTIDLLVHHRKGVFPLQSYIVNKPVQAILGLIACEELNIIQRVENIREDEGCDIFKVYEDLFSPNNTGCLPVTHHLETGSNVKRVVHPPRQVLAALRPKIKAELDRMEKLGVVTPITTPTPWVSSLVTVVKPDKIRLCIDPKGMNQAIRREYYPMKTIEDVLTRLTGAKVFSILDAASGI